MISNPDKLLGPSHDALAAGVAPTQAPSYTELAEALRRARRAMAGSPEHHAEVDALLARIDGVQPSQGPSLREAWKNLTAARETLPADTNAFDAAWDEMQRTIDGKTKGSTSSADDRHEDDTDNWW